MSVESEKMSRLLKRSLAVYIAAMVICIAGYVRYDSYVMDGDAVAFLDMSRYLQQGKPGLAVNGYWNPGYSVALAIGDWVMRPGRYEELKANYTVNGVIFVLALVAVCFFARSLTALRNAWGEEGRRFALSSTALQLLGCAIVFNFWLQEISVARVRSDGLLLVFLVASAGFAMRLLATQRWVYALPLGLMLGGAYYTKSFGFVAAAILLGLMFVAVALSRRVTRLELPDTGVRGKLLMQLVAAGVLFLVAVAPYIAGISRQRGRLTTGESSRLNYLWYINHADTLHEAYSHNFGNATAELKHPERRLLTEPMVYSYDEHLNGTEPAWFDPAWWHDKMTPRRDIPAQMKAIANDLKLTARYVLIHVGPLAVLALLWVFGYRMKLGRGAMLCLIPTAWGFVMWLVYLLVLIQDRYVDAAYLVFMLPLFALLEEREDRVLMGAPLAAVAVVLMYGAGLVAIATKALTEVHAVIALQRFPGGWYDPTMQETARGLAAIGVRPGDRVACVGETVCHFDPYWAYMAGAQIVADVVDSPLSTTATPTDAALMSALHSVQAKVMVGEFPVTSTLPAGWQRLGHGPYVARVVP